MKKVNFLRLILSILLLAVAFAINPFLGFGLLAIGLVKGIWEAEFSPAGSLTVDGFVINDTTYAGEVASQFIVKALTGADTIMGGHVYIKDNIKKKYTIPRWDANYEDFIQDRAATPVSKGSMTVDGKVLDPQDYMIYTEFNPRDFEDHWFATQLNPTLIDRKLPYSVESVVVQEVLKRHAKYFNKGIWNNDMTLSTIYKYWDGYLTNMANDADVVDVSSPTTFDTNNIQAELKKGYDAIGPELRYDPDMKYFCSYKTFDLYGQSQRDQVYKGVDITQLGSDKFIGKQVVKIADFPDDKYVIARGNATPGSNLWVGMNSVADEGLKLAPKQANSELWFIKMLMKADVQIGWGSECVAYGL